jgi:LysM repeat protein
MRYIITLIMSALLLKASAYEDIGRSNINSPSSVVSSPHQVKKHANKVNYIIARKGDTYVRIAKEFGMGLWQLHRYNDHSLKQDCLREGEIVYLQPKRKYSKVRNVITVSSTSTLTEISQKEAVSVKSLLRLNKDITSEFQLLKSGSKVTLH